MRTLCFLVLLSAACGGNGKMTSTTSKCHGHASGVVDSDFNTCSFGWTEAADGTAQLDGSIVYPSGSNLSSGLFSLLVHGDAHPGAFSTSDGLDGIGGTDVGAGAAGINSYLADHNAANGVSLGAMTANITAIEEAFSGTSGKQWDLHGTFSATFVTPPNANYTGTISVDGTF